jgi:hypothetical protein
MSARSTEDVNLFRADPAMTLLDVLTVITFVTPISGAVETAKHAHEGFWGYATALLLGLIIGIGCGWAVRASAARMVLILEDNPKKLKGRLYLGACFCALALWPLFAGFLGGWATSSVHVLLR